MLKHQYKIIFNKNKKSKFKYTYRYSRNNVNIEIGDNCIVISLISSSRYNNKVIEDNVKIFSNAIKKSMLVHLIKYSKSIKIDNIEFSIDDVQETIYNFKIDNKPIIFSLIDKIDDNMYSDFSKKEIEELLKINSSDNDLRMVALTSFLIAQSKEYENEKFIYNWMAFNSLYNYICKYTKDIRQDCKKLKFYKYYIGKRLEVNSLNNNKIDIIKTIDKYILKNNVNNINFEKLKKEISSKIKQYDFDKEDVYLFVLIDYIYSYRCKYFHGDKELILFNYANDDKIKILNSLNLLLKEFISFNLRKCFDNDFKEKISEDVNKKYLEYKAKTKNNEVQVWMKNKKKK